MANKQYRLDVGYMIKYVLQSDDGAARGFWLTSLITNSISVNIPVLKGGHDPGVFKGEHSVDGAVQAYQ